MSHAFQLVQDEEAPPPQAPLAPRVFTRTILTRAAAPWDQSRQAALEARLGAPARLADIVFRLRRLDPWRPGQGARFAAIYVRACDVGRGFTAAAAVEGVQLSVDFTSPAEHAARARRLLLLGAAAGAVAGLLVVTGAALAGRRTAAADALAAAEQLAQTRQHQAAEVAAAGRDAAQLDRLGLRGQTLERLAGDLAWLSHAKAASAHIEAVHWDHGFMGVEADGDQAPLQADGRPLQRSSAPVRPGVWLWGVGASDEGPRP
jgi:hypothetical protein